MHLNFKGLDGEFLVFSKARFIYFLLGFVYFMTLEEKLGSSDESTFLGIFYLLIGVQYAVTSLTDPSNDMTIWMNFLTYHHC